MFRLFTSGALVATLAVWTPSPCSATLIPVNTLVDSPELWSGWVDWFSPGTVSTVSLPATYWSLSLLETVLSGGGSGLLVVTARHLVSPHPPPELAGPPLYVSFFPAMPGAALPAVVSAEPHPDDPGHQDILTAALVSLDPTISRVQITVQHGGPLAVPEPSMTALTLPALVSAGVLRRRRRARRDALNNGVAS